MRRWLATGVLITALGACGGGDESTATTSAQATMTTSSTSSATTNSAAGTAATAEPSTFNSNDDEAAAERIPLTAGSLVDVPSGRWHRHVEATDPSSSTTHPAKASREGSCRRGPEGRNHRR